MIEALWSVEFISNNGAYGAGVVVFESGKVFGGDSSYFYLGTYTINNGILSAEVSANHYNGPLNNIVGPVAKVTWVLSGTVARNTFDIQGHAKEVQSNVHVRLTHRANLP